MTKAIQRRAARKVERALQSDGLPKIADIQSDIQEILDALSSDVDPCVCKAEGILEIVIEALARAREYLQAGGYEQFEDES